ICRSGDLAINTLWAWMAALGVSRETGLVSPAYGVYRQRDESNFHPEYIDFLLRTQPYATEYRCRSTGITTSRLRLYPIDFLRIPLVQPPRDEQEMIVNYLRRQDTLVRKFIRNRRRLIEVLSEQKQAIINQAVTRGLDPTGPLKPSGVEWIGDVPEHWDILKLRTLFKQHGSGTTPSGNEYYGGDIPWVMTGDLNDTILNTTQRTVTPQALSDFSALRLYPVGSLLVALYGATIGKTGVLAMDACTNQACCVLAEPQDGVNARYIQAVVLVGKQHLVNQSYGGGQPNINSEIVRSLRVPLPPRDEQNQILAAIERQTCDLDSAVATADREIDLIREYRARLIADVVTGKLDIRHLDPPPDSLKADDVTEIDADEFDDELADDEDAELVEEAENA
ncbi:MAG: restriction endonuclease subunit S, partial [Candidatus Paceibacterota bacterium]